MYIIYRWTGTLYMSLASGHMVLKGNAQNAVYMCVWINFVRSNIFSRFGKLKQDIQNYITSK